MTVIDKGSIGGGCSHSNCGLVCPSHVLPLAEPGAVLSTLKSIIKPNSPLRVRPRLDREFLRWVWRFSRRCNQADMLQSGRAIHRLLTSSTQLYEQLVQHDGLECQWQKQGLLFVYQHRLAMDQYASVNDLVTAEFNEPARRMSGEEVAEFEPSLKTGLAGGWFFEHDAHVKPERLLASWQTLLEGRGVRFIENNALVGLVEADGEVVAAQLEHSVVEADELVVATGAWTPQLAKILRVRIPIEPGKGYSVTVARPPKCPSVPMVFPEHRVVVTPLECELRIGSVMELAGYDDSIRPERLRLLTDGASHYLRAAVPDQFSEPWYGWRPMTYDSTPVIGECPGFANVYLATGHNMLGLSMAPATGRLIAEMITGQPTHIPTDAYSASRFQTMAQPGSLS